MFCMAGLASNIFGYLGVARPESRGVVKYVLTACGEQSHDSVMLVLGGKRQRRSAIRVFSVAVRTLGEQQFDHFGMAVGSSLMQRCPTIITGEIDIGTTGN